MADDRIMRGVEVLDMLSISRATLDRMPSTDPTFPKKIKLSENMTGYSYNELVAWLEEKKSKRLYAAKETTNG